MDISVKKLSEILKIDPQVLLDKMIAAGLSQTSIEDSVSNEDKQKLLSFIRSSKDLAVDDKPKAVVPTTQAPKKAPKKQPVWQSLKCEWREVTRVGSRGLSIWWPKGWWPICA